MGRHPYSNRKTVESCIKMPIKHAKRYLGNPNKAYESYKDGCRIYVKYLDGKKTLIILQDFDNGTKLDLTFEILQQDCYYGNKRYYFACPGCHKKAYTLYSPQNIQDYRCRQCHNLTYREQKGHNKKMDMYKGFGYEWKIDELGEKGAYRTIRGRRKIEKLERKRDLAHIKNYDKLKLYPI